MTYARSPQQGRSQSSHYLPPPRALELSLTWRFFLRNMDFQRSASVGVGSRKAKMEKKESSFIPGNFIPVEGAPDMHPCPTRYRAHRLPTFPGAARVRCESLTHCPKRWPGAGVISPWTDDRIHIRTCPEHHPWVPSWPCSHHNCMLPLPFPTPTLSIQVQFMVSLASLWPFRPTHRMTLTCSHLWPWPSHSASWSSVGPLGAVEGSQENSLDSLPSSSIRWSLFLLHGFWFLFIILLWISLKMSWSHYLKLV